MNHTEMKDTEQQTIQYRFPSDFWWGSSASATQTEGTVEETAKDRTFGIIGLSRSRTVFMTGLDLAKRPVSIPVTKKILHS